MVFEPNITKVVSSIRKNIGITQSQVELKLPTNEDVVEEVYSVSARSSITSYDVSGKDVTFWGLIDFQAIFKSVGISALDYTAEFKDKYTADEELMGELIITSNVIDVSSSVVSGGIRVVAIVETTIDVIESKDVSVVRDIAGDVYLSKKQITYSEYVGRASEKFDVTGDIELKNTSRVLMVTPSVCIGSVEAKENYLVVTGVINVDICYQSGENLNDMMSHNHVLDFSTEVALSGIEETSNIQSVISIVSNEIKVSTAIEGEDAIVNLYVPILYSGYVFNRETIEVVDDVYSETNYLSITTDNFETLDSDPSVSFRDNISGTVSILDTSPFIDDILGVCTNNIVLASSRVENNILYVEGVANSTVVYFTKETESITSVQVEMPFSVEERADGLNSSVVTLCLSNVSARSKRGKEIEVSGELSIFADMYSTDTLNVVSNVVLSDEKPKDDCSLYIYIVKPGETLWDIAKEMNVSVDLLLEQNEDIDLPLVGGEKLVVYKPNMVRF